MHYDIGGEEMLACRELAGGGGGGAGGEGSFAVWQKGDSLSLYLFLIFTYWSPATH